MDNFDKNTYKKIQERKQTKEPYENTFNAIVCEELSNTEARKELKGIEKYLDRKMEIEDQSIVNEDLPKYNETTELCSDGNYKSDKLLKMSKEESKDINYLLKAHGFDNGYWEIVNAKNNVWNVYSKQDGVQQLYSSKITVKPIVPEFKEEWIQNVIDNINLSKVKIKNYEQNIKDGITVEINFCDVHIGKYITALIAAGNYNSDIAIKQVREAINKAIERTSHYKIKKIIFVAGQDYMNIDTLQGTTTKQTRQDMHEFYQITYEKALDLLIETIETLRLVAPVDVIYVKGNHDKLTTYTMVTTLSKLYKDCDDVNVDNSMRQRKYKVIGNTLLGLGHGEEEKSRIFDCMQEDQKENWNKKYKYFHLSHRHSESRKEKAGVIYNWLGCLSESCRWTWESGFVGSEKKGHVYIYDDEEGKIGEYFIKV